MPLYSVGERHPKPPREGSFWIAPSADVIGDVTLAENVGVWFGAVLRGDNDPISLEEGVNIQDSAVIHTEAGHGVRIGRRCTVGHRAIVHGCDIGENCLIGMGATIMNGARIGANSLVGAHALVAEGQSFPEGSLILGTPARVTRQLSVQEVARIGVSAEHYIAKWQLYARTLKLAPG